MEEGESAPNSHQSRQEEVSKQLYSLFETTKRRPEQLGQLYQALLTARPTSVEPQRVFSIMNYFVTKIRNRMSDRKLDAMVWMRQRFRRQK